MSTIEWETPDYFFKTLDLEFHFTVDACANQYNTKCFRFWSKDNDGLSKDWSKEIVWLNPPYDRSISKWIEKAYNESLKGAIVVALIQGRSTDTKMWHDYVMRASEIRFIKDRLHFKDESGRSARANISSVLVVFKNDRRLMPAIYSIDIYGRKLNANQSHSK